MAGAVTSTTSAARVEANRRNAQKSTGPRTAEGKARSRRNGVKHGLSGRGVALLGEDAAAVEARFATLQAEERPASLLGQLVLHQVALASVRVERAAKLEAAALEPLIRHAEADFERERLAEVDRLFETIETCPGDHRRRLLAHPEGVDKLVAALTSARDQLRSGVCKRWTPADKKKVEALFGGTAGQFPATRTDGLLLGLVGDDSYFGAEEAARLHTREERTTWAAAELIATVEAELAWLAEARAALDLDALDRDRRSAPARAGARPDAGLALARKYAAAASRDFARTYRDHRRAQQDESEAETEIEEAAPAPVGVEPDAAPAEVAPTPASDEVGGTSGAGDPSLDAAEVVFPATDGEQDEPDVGSAPSALGRHEPNPSIPPPTSLRPTSMRFPDDHVPDRPFYAEIRSE